MIAAQRENIDDALYSLLGFPLNWLGPTNGQRWFGESGFYFVNFTFANERCVRKLSSARVSEFMNMLTTSSVGRVEFINVTLRCRAYWWTRWKFTCRSYRTDTLVIPRPWRHHGHRINTCIVIVFSSNAPPTTSIFSSTICSIQNAWDVPVVDTSINTVCKIARNMHSI